MATVRHLGLFPRAFAYCPSTDLEKSDFVNLQEGQVPDIWMTLTEALAMYWRVKKWRFSISANWEETGGENSVVFSYSNQREFAVGQASVFDFYSLGGNFVDGKIPENERKLACGAAFEFIDPDTGNKILVDGHFLSFISTDVTSGGSTTTIRGDLKWLHNLPPVFARPKNKPVEFKPTIFFEARTFRWSIIRASSWQSAGTSPIGTYGTFSYEFLEKTFNAPIYAYNTRATSPNFANNLNMTASLTAIEYWEYDPNDGQGPIYNKNTGKQLRPFPPY